MTRFRFACLLAFVVGFVPLSGGIGQAGSSHYHPQDWSGPPIIRVDSTMIAPFNTATARSEIGAGRLTWNNVAGASIDMTLGATLDMANTIALSNVPQGYAYVTESLLSAGTFGVTGCRINYILFRIDACLTELDANNVPWEIGSAGTHAAAGTLDLRSAAAHELGHVMGFEGGSHHVEINCDIWSDAANGANTMCKTLKAAPSVGAMKIYRTAAPHEATDHDTNY